MDATRRNLSVQPDGKIVLGGAFTTFNGMEHDYVTLLNADGSLDTGFDFNTGSGANSNVLSVTMQADRKIVLGGAFTTFNGVTRNRVARLNADIALPPGVSVVGVPVFGGFIVSRNGDTDRAITVLYHNGGSAARGVDYGTFSGRLTFGVGQREARIAINLLPGANRTKKVKVILDAAPNGEYDIGKAQSKVFLSDLP